MASTPSTVFWNPPVMLLSGKHGAVYRKERKSQTLTHITHSHCLLTAHCTLVKRPSCPTRYGGMPLQGLPANWCVLFNKQAVVCLPKQSVAVTEKGTPHRSNVGPGSSVSLLHLPLAKLHTLYCTWTHISSYLAGVACQ